MQHTLTIVASLLVIGAAIPYIIDTAKGTTRPNVVTWFTWMLLNGINAAATFSDGAWQSGLYALGATIATGLIVILGFRQGLKRYTVFDIFCQIAALAGIAAWLITSQPMYAVMIQIVTDFFGGLPTVRHAWRAPHEETLVTFVISWAAGVLMLLSLQRFDFVAVALPAYILVFDTVLIGVITYRRKIRGGTPLASELRRNR